MQPVLHMKKMRARSQRLDGLQGNAQKYVLKRYVQLHKNSRRLTFMLFGRLFEYKVDYTSDNQLMASFQTVK